MVPNSKVLCSRKKERKKEKKKERNENMDRIPTNGIYIYIYTYIYIPSVGILSIYMSCRYICIYIYIVYIYINIHSIPFPGRRKLSRSFSISDRKFSPYTKVIKTCSFTVSINCRLCVAWSFRAPHHRGDGIIDECRIAMCARASLREKIESNYIYIYIFKRLKKRR